MISLNWRAALSVRGWSSAALSLPDECLALRDARRKISMVALSVRHHERGSWWRRGRCDLKRSNTTADANHHRDHPRSTTTEKAERSIEAKCAATDNLGVSGR